MTCYEIEVEMFRMLIREQYDSINEDMWPWFLNSRIAEAIVLL